jgi:hypothetical protein
MRFVSLGLYTILALACGDRDESSIDPNYRKTTSDHGPGADSNPEPPATLGGDERDVGEVRPDDPAMTAQPNLSACGEGSAGGATCSDQGPADNAASADGQRPPDDGDGAGGTGHDANATAGKPGTAAGSGTNGAAGSGGTDGSAGQGSGGTDGSAGQGSSQELELLPDLVIDGAYLMATIQQDVVDASADQCLFNEGCVTGEGPRRVVRFGTRSGNVGSADVVVGEPVAGNPLWEFDACHQHFHFEGYARYDLVDASTGQVLPIGNKNGFCLRDLDSWDNPSCGTYDCDYQGISVGCADVYTPDLDC